jgi:dihydroxyacetone kinase-like predicted kinase
MPRDEGVEVMCTISLSPLDAAMMRQRLDEMGDSVIMSQVGGGADAAGLYRWRVHVHVLDADLAVALIRSLGEPTDISVSELAVPRDPEAPAATVAATAAATVAPARAAETRNPDGHAR